MNGDTSRLLRSLGIRPESDGITKRKYVTIRVAEKIRVALDLDPVDIGT